MATSIVFTLVGPDRPGLVDKIASCVAKAGGNWEESQLAHLGGQFAGMVRVRIEPANEAALREGLATLEGLTVTVATARDEFEPRGRNVHLEVLGTDRPGIVKEIGHTLANFGINIEELTTSTESAAMTGETLFRAEAELCIPEGLPPKQVREALEQLADELMVELVLQEPT